MTFMKIGLPGSLTSAAALLLLTGAAAQAALVTDPDDLRVWQGATVGTFAQLYYGANTAATRQQVIDNKLLDDGIFDPTGSTAAPLIQANGVNSTGVSFDTDGTTPDPYAYGNINVHSATTAGSAVDNIWLQTSNVLGDAIWDLGALASKAAIFNTIDHGPLPQEAIESTVYLSNDKVNWTQAVTERVWLEGFVKSLGVKWDGFAYAVGTGTSAQFRYASIIWGGPGALQSDGDNEINGVLGLDVNFRPTDPSAVPLPAAMPLLLGALGGFGFLRRRKS